MINKNKKEGTHGENVLLDSNFHNNQSCGDLAETLYIDASVNDKLDMSDMV
jgi:hypothetical protein